ncbi:hypothetical protein CS060_07595 [Anoxybacillus flavithermus]|uniref:Uncharacterized protein n=1 Tax=Anoxybacillus flavithermus TaxID=33934 RepID=A0A2G5RPW0_9BACL|nr:hypothetical protein [Anoxybacillus flavithermus]PIC04844.1 hypothetical protein CS060_07595 [Anoxybacillus flavithermus]
MWFLFIVGLLCGYFMIAWTPTVEPFVLEVFLTDIIFDPMKTFFALVSFFIGFISNAILIRAATWHTLQAWRKETTNRKEQFLSYSVLLTFFILAIIDVKKTIIFFLFSFAYGMMSMSVYKEREN